MTCCGKRTPPENLIDFKKLGCPCDTWAHMKDQFIYLKDERAGVVPCKPDQFKVQWAIINPMTYLYAVTDLLTGELCEYSVVKEYPHEGPEAAFERDYRVKELRHNRGVRRAIDDTLEAFEELYPTLHYKLSEDKAGFKIHHSIRRNLGVISWKIDYGYHRHHKPMNLLEWVLFYPDHPIDIPNVLPEVGSALQLLIKRMRKTGVHFEKIETVKVHDLDLIEITGGAYLNSTTMATVKITYQEMDINKPTLNAYYEYYTEKGPQDGIYNC